ncbi:acetolactate decarboxylase (plasmid) [Pedobacter sp. BS3]|uniref:acetolactate decarboxylase n=1 Tax=Pedobacter sp. BS3 TaxID=2567937 RepID=UPI0011EC2BD2|nr:acetolactate decarboxylase [Pedobacter sp. BS3]TZF85846.1 acetolactate decarboxylase [Pedobacter sp. BS3]
MKQYVLILLCLYHFNANAQHAESKENNTLYTAGHAGAFIGGLYDAYYPYSKLKLHGDFGLGAPDKLDGELLLLNGHIYQTQSSGKTFEIPDTGFTPFAVVNFFHADKVFKATLPLSKDKLCAYLDSVLPNQNGIYAIHIKGTFGQIKTRAFPPVMQKPYKPLAAMLNLQHFFSFHDVRGELVGYRIPDYMEGPNISGYHFHFLSADKQSGGHIVDLQTGAVTIEVDVLDSFTVDIPQTSDFEHFDFTKDRREEVKQVENGKK